MCHGIMTKHILRLLDLWKHSKLLFNHSSFSTPPFRKLITDTHIIIKLLMYKVYCSMQKSIEKFRLCLFIYKYFIFSLNVTLINSSLSLPLKFYCIHFNIPRRIKMVYIPLYFFKTKPWKNCTKDLFWYLKHWLHTYRFIVISF